MQIGTGGSDSGAPRRLGRALAAPVLALAVFVAPSSGLAQAQLLSGFGGDADFGVDALEPGDDGSSAAIDLSAAFPDGLNFFGSAYTEIFVNNNGNVSFNEEVPFFIPAAFPVSNQPMIAPWWGDVDTRLQGAGIANDIYWHVDVAGGRFIVTWFEVGHFSLQTDEFNNFQLILTDRSDVEPGDFDVEFRYNRCEWHTGDRPQTGADPLPAQAGFDAGNDRDFVALPGSLTASVVDLCEDSNRDDPGVWVFEIRVGDVFTCGNAIPELDEECDEGIETVTCDGDCSAVACGDGYRNEAADEVCDDGNRLDADGCSQDCDVEPGWVCERADVESPDVCEPICGDGQILGDEGCDDQNTADGDGCSASCQVEPGFLCEGEPSVCREDVGDAQPSPDMALDLGPDVEFSGGGLSGCRQAGTGSDARFAWLLTALAVAWLRRRQTERTM